ncbi:Protein of unknown function [Lactobacillus delbrueckii subsp. lactis]|nr:Protein of unknown function [Lactobacillus delbrueckii subsp. lactis]
MQKLVKPVKAQLQATAAYGQPSTGT